MGVFSLTLLLIYISIKASASSDRSHRLPTSVKPSFYEITINPNLTSSYYRGQVTIDVTSTRELPSIFLHVLRLSIKEIQLDGERTRLFKRHKSVQMLEIFRFDNGTIASGPHTIFIKYRGKINKDHSEHGLFHSYYDDDEQWQLWATDSEPTHARKIFPCFDEPGLKAKFQVSVLVPRGYDAAYRAISNMDETMHLATKSGTLYKFDSSPKMSAYLVSFAITNYPYHEILANDRKIRIFSPLAKNESCMDVADMVANFTDFYSNYFKVANPIKKIDIIEFDREVSAGTENWGLITVKTGYLCPRSNDFLVTIANVISHEIGHFWFGNFVTAGWWDDLWLQEGSTTYFCLKAVDALDNPDFNTDHFKAFTSAIDSIYGEEIRENTTAIVKRVETLKEINNQFIHITYDKGAMIFRMLEDVLTENTLKLVLNKIQTQFAYSTITTFDFIQLVENYNPYIRSFLKTFLYQNKYPVLSVRIENNEYVLSQKCAGVDKIANKSLVWNQKWTIPVSYVTNKNNVSEIEWFDKDMDELKIRKGDESWIKFNTNANGYYLVAYDDELWSNFRITDDINNVSLLDYSNLLKESISLYLIGSVHCKFPIEFGIYLKKSKKLSGLLGLYLQFMLEEIAHVLKEDADIVYESLGISNRKFDNVFTTSPEYVIRCVEWINSTFIYPNTSTNKEY